MVENTLIDFAAWYQFGATVDVFADCPLANSDQPLAAGDPTGYRPDAGFVSADEALYAKVRLRDKWREARKKAAADRICSADNYFVVIRHRVEDVLGEYDLCPSIRFLPCEITTHDERPIWEGEYVIGVGWKEWDVADYDKSDVHWSLGVDAPPIVLWINKWVVHEEKMPELDLFRVYPSGWFVSRRLRERFEEEGFTGMKFIPVEIA